MFVRCTAADIWWPQTIRSLEALSGGLLDVSLRHLTDQLGPIHVNCCIDRASLGATVVFEDLDHEGRVISEDNASLHHP